MSNNLPNPKRLLTLGALALVVGANFNAPRPLAAQSPRQPTSSPAVVQPSSRMARADASPRAAGNAARPTPESVAQAAQRAEELIRAAADSVRKLSSVQALVRQRMRLFDRSIAGSGRYLQTGTADRPMWILELKLQAGQLATLRQEVCDGDVLWRRTQRERSDDTDEVEVSRIDLEVIRSTLARRGRRPRELDFAALGGLPRILDSLADHYDFQTAQTGQLSNEPVWVLHGRRRKTRGESAEIVHAPDAVQVILSRDEQLPLFPYRVEYRRVAAGKEEGAPPIIEPILVTEWYSIQVSQKLDPRVFQFLPGDVEIIDKTDDVMDAVGERDP